MNFEVSLVILSFWHTMICKWKLKGNVNSLSLFVRVSISLPVNRLANPSLKCLFMCTYVKHYCKHTYFIATPCNYFAALLIDQSNTRLSALPITIFSF